MVGIVLGKQPRHEIHRTNRHADAKNDPGQQALRSALAEGKRDTADDDRDQTEATGESGQ